MLCLFAFLFSFHAFAQTVIFNANFQDTTGDNAWFNTEATNSEWIRGGGGNRYMRVNRWFNYRSDVRIVVQSPPINFSSYENLTLDVIHFYRTNPGIDGMRIEYQIGATGAWQVLGSEASGYYNDTDVDAIANNADGWSGANAPSNVFTAAPTLNMSAFDPALDGASDVSFRVVFQTQTSFTGGVAFDNFVIRGTLVVAPEIEVTGLGNIIADGDTTPSLLDDTDMGAAEANTATVIKTFTINNTGTQPLDLTDIANPVQIFGPDAAQFSVGAQPGITSIPPGGSTTFDIYYTPTALGPHNATVSIANNDANENPYDFNIVGQGIGPEPEVQIVGNGLEILNGDTTPSPLDGTYFGTITQGITTTRTFTVNNIGALNLSLTSPDPHVLLTGPNAGLFSVTVVPDTTVPPDGSTSFSITYTPIGAGVHTATVTLPNNDSNEGSYSFAIEGESLGQRPEIEVIGDNILITNNDTTPNSFDGTDFGNVVIGSPKTNTFQISNVGLLDLNLTSTPDPIVISGPDAGQFSISLVPATTIPSSGGSVTFEITYNPTAAGIHNASISFENTDDDENPFLFDITGGAVVTAEPEIEVSGAIGIPIFDGDNTPSTVDNTDYGTVYLGENKIFSHNIRNLGTDDLMLSGTPTAVYLTGDTTQFTIVTYPNVTVVPPSDLYVAYEIKYQPTTAGTHTAVVHIPNNDADESPFTYTITGNSSINPNPIETIYYENFDETNGNWTPATVAGGTTWTYGINPSEPSEGNCWYTSPYNDYTNNALTRLTSPNINTTGYERLQLLLDINYDTDADIDNDGMNVEYSADGGTTWNVLGAYSATPEDNWYNNNDLDGIGNNVPGWSGLTTGNAPGTSKSDFIEVAIDLPPSLDNNAQAQIRVNFGSNNSTTDNGVSVDNVFIKGTPLVSPADPALGPGGLLSNLKLWLKANENTGTTTNGGLLTFWGDNAYNNDAIGFGSTRPTFYDEPANNVNFNPSVDFNRGARTVLKGKGGYSTKEYWLVVQPDGPIAAGQPLQGILSGRAIDNEFSEDGTGIAINPGSLRFSGVNNLVSHLIGSTPATVAATDNDSYGRAAVSPTDMSVAGEVMILHVKEGNGVSEIYLNGKRIDNYTGRTSGSNEDLPYTDVVNSQYAVGALRATLNGHPANMHFEGKVTEVISYKSANSLIGFLKIQSYLAMKYGVSLQDRTEDTPRGFASQYYYDSDGNIIWNPIANASHSWDVAAIGRDDASTLNQKQSKSSNLGSLLTIGLTDIYNTNNENISTNPNIINNLNFLIWGNDREPLAAATPVFVDISNGNAGVNTPVSFTAIERSWKVIEHGDIATTKVAIPASALSSLITPPGAYIMLISDTPVFGPTSDFRFLTLNGANLETTYDFNGTKYITFAYAPEYVYTRSIAFDGVDDYLDADNTTDLAGSFTMSAWIKRDAGSENRDIISKRNAAPFTEGYTMKLDGSGHAGVEWYDAGGNLQTLYGNTSIPLNEWHQVATIFDGSETVLYVDGVEDGRRTMSLPAATAEHFIIGAADYRNPSSHYIGHIDEVRVWSTALTTEQLRYMMNQEIRRFTDASTTGTVIPQGISKNDIRTLPWSSLDAYFPMTTYTFTSVKDNSDNNLAALMKNLDTVDEQTAPLPYSSAVDGDWEVNSTWNNGNLQYLPNSLSIVDNTTPIDWNIVETNHAVQTNDNVTILGLFVASNELTADVASKVEVSHYLELNGTLDLEGEAQLIQTTDSDLSVGPVGKIEIDQQGTANQYNYNFWGSPVTGPSATANNANYTVSQVLNDGTDPSNPQLINWVGGYDGSAATSPISLADFWVLKFNNFAIDDYSSWQFVGAAGTMLAGEGFTLKGPGGAATDTQNYVFVGKPNNSTTAEPIELTINGGNEYLVGNPFPSAIDANRFILDNLHLDGSLYFWEHWGGESHFLSEYQAGYATYNLMGGVPAVSDPAVDQTGSGTKTPGQFIPVGQGFFVKADTNGNVAFDNSQRYFAKESTDDSIFTFAEEIDGEDTASTRDAENENLKDLRPKIRLDYYSANEYHRVLLLGVDENTTFGVDRMYDAINFEDLSNDMSFINEGDRLVIQGVPEFKRFSVFPLEVRNSEAGTIRIKINSLQNWPSNVAVFLRDKRRNRFTYLQSRDFTIHLGEGTFNNRFQLVFFRFGRDTQQRTQGDISLEDIAQMEAALEGQMVSNEDEAFTPENEVTAVYNSGAKHFQVRKQGDLIVKGVALYNMLGQNIQSWSPTHDDLMTLPVQQVTSGVYILRIVTDHGVHTQKFIID